MTQDARFEDADEQPLHLKARDAHDLQIIATLVQDAVLPMTETAWQPGQKRFGMLLNRFRWEDKTQAEESHRAYERVQSLLVIDSVETISSMGIDRHNKEQIISILSVDFKAGPDGTGKLVFTLAGDGALALGVECLDVTLKDVTKPYAAISKSAPHHQLD